MGPRKRTGSGQSREKRYELSDESEPGGRPQPRLPLPGASATWPGEQRVPWPGAGIVRRWGWLRSCPGPERKNSIGAQSTRSGSGRGSGRGPPAAPVVGDMGASQAGRRQPPHQSGQRVLAHQQPGENPRTPAKAAGTPPRGPLIPLPLPPPPGRAGAQMRPASPRGPAEPTVLACPPGPAKPLPGGPHGVQAGEGGRA